MTVGRLTRYLSHKGICCDVSGWAPSEWQIVSRVSLYISWPLLLVLYLRGWTKWEERGGMRLLHHHHPLDFHPCGRFSIVKVRRCKFRRDPRSARIPFDYLHKSTSSSKSLWLYSLLSCCLPAIVTGVSGYRIVDYSVTLFFFDFVDSFECLFHISLGVWKDKEEKFWRRNLFWSRGRKASHAGLHVVVVVRR